MFDEKNWLSFSYDVFSKIEEEEGNKFILVNGAHKDHASLHHASEEESNTSHFHRGFEKRVSSDVLNRYLKKIGLVQHDQFYAALSASDIRKCVTEYKTFLSTKESRSSICKDGINNAYSSLAKGLVTFFGGKPTNGKKLQSRDPRLLGERKNRRRP